MEVPAGFEELLEVTLEVDQEALQEEIAERGSTMIIGDEELAVLMRQNRIALAKGTATVVPQTEDLERTYFDLPLICALRPHPECQFQWAYLQVDLIPAREARIEDMAPREVRGTKAVEIKTTIGLTMKFATVAKVIDAEAGPTYSRSRTLYFPEILSDGVGFAKGYWDFRAAEDNALHANRELRLLISAPTGIPIDARFRLEARVRRRGLAGIVPLLARAGRIDETYRLT